MWIYLNPLPAEQLDPTLPRPMEREKEKEKEREKEIRVTLTVQGTVT